MMIDSKELKQVLTASLEQMRARGKQKLNAVGHAYINASMEVMGKLMVFITNAEKQENFNMGTLKDELVAGIGKLGDILPRGRRSEVQEVILQKAEELESLIKEAKSKKNYSELDLPVLIINTDKVNARYFVNTVGNLQRDGKLSKSIKAVARKHRETKKDMIYLVKVEE